jgi:TPR repeat protein
MIFQYFCETFPMKTLLTTLYLTVTILLVNVEKSSSADYQKGLTAARSGNHVNALREFRVLAEQGHASAQYSLGLMYDNGRGVTQDYKKSVKWYRKSVEQGHAEAQYNLGVMYGNGNGVRQDSVYAHMWFDIVASNGDENGAMNRDIVAKRMTKKQLAEAQKLARECVRKKYKGC